MPSLLPDWTSEQVLALAPDTESARAAQALASTWHSLGFQETIVWGQYKGSGSKPYQVNIDLSHLQQRDKRMGCSCPSRKQPCKHQLALLLLLVETPERVSAQPIPDAVQKWLDKQNSEPKKREVKAIDPEQQAKTLAERKAKIAQGFDELERWLRNMMRHGLGDSQLRHYNYWDSKAARMVDAQAPGIARWLRDMAGIPAAGGNWVDRLMGELGRLYLVIEGFKRFDELSPALQADMRSVLGWTYKKEEIPDPLAVKDRWYVIGRYEGQEEDRLRVQRLWLRGETTGRDALILEFAFGNQGFESKLPPGMSFEATIAFFPSNYPLRAFIQQEQGISADAPGIRGESIESAIQRYSAALASNPWLMQFPMLLQGVIPVQLHQRWIIRASEGHALPISPHFASPWTLTAISGGHPITVMGEWNGTVFLPISAIVNGRMIDFNQAGRL